MSSIKTKFSVGQYVWVNYEGYQKHWEIRGIDIKVRGESVKITYELKPMSSSYLYTFSENEICKTEKEFDKKFKKMLR